MINKENLLEKIKKQHSLHDINLKQFFDYLNASDELSLVLKSHLEVEKIINNLILIILPKPSKIIKEYTFTQKINLLEALNMFPKPLIYEKLRKLNDIRNDFSHEQKSTLKEEDVLVLEKGYDAKAESVQKRYISSIYRIIGYLLAIHDANLVLPYLESCQRNNAILARDPGYKIKEVAKDYPENIYQLFKRQ